MTFDASNTSPVRQDLLDRITKDLGVPPAVMAAPSAPIYSLGTKVRSSLPVFSAPRGGISYYSQKGTLNLGVVPRKVGFQQMAKAEGRKFEGEVVYALRRAGWAIHGTRTRFLGVEIDIIASPPGGPRCLIECKGGNLVGRSGLARADTVKKSIGLAWVLQRRQYRGQNKPLPYLLVTTMMPKKKTSGYKMLEEALHGSSRLFEHVGTINDILAWGDIYSSFYQRYHQPWHFSSAAHGFDPSRIAMVSQV